MKGPRDWTVGTDLPERVLRPVDRLSLIRYAGASGDFNPIHTIDEEAREAGLPGVIQHGMLTMAQMGLLLTPYIEDGFIELFQTRFVGMLPLGETLRLGGRVTAVEPRENGVRFSCDVHARTTEGRAIARGSLRFVWYGPRAEISENTRSRPTTAG